MALTSLLLLVFDPGTATGQPSPDGAVVSESANGTEAAAMDAGSVAPPAESAGEVAEATTAEARRVLSGVRDTAVGALPKVALVLALLLLAWLLVRLIRFTLRRTLGNWPRSSAVTAISAVVVWLLAVSISMTILAGDVRAFLGSVGLLGLAASWALQTPIESFTGWLLNAFRGYYRVGDRIEVGEIFGDVHRIDVLTTTVWEIGSPYRPGFVRAEQPTGRLITFPNNQILTGSVMNLTRDFPYVWDELTIAVANESDLRYAMNVLQREAGGLLGESSREAAEQYEGILRRAGLPDGVPLEPEVFLAYEDAWMSMHVRYLVHSRQRRKQKSELILRVSEALNRPEHRGKIIPVVPRQQVQFIGRDGRAREASWFAPLEED